MSSSRGGRGSPLLVRRISYEGALMVSACEADLVGRTLVEGDLRVDLNTAYFSGEEMDLDEAMRLVEEAEIVSLVGRSIVDEALRRGLAHPGAVRTIEGVPFLMVYKFTSSTYRGHRETL